MNDWLFERGGWFLIVMLFMILSTGVFASLYISATENMQVANEQVIQLREQIARVEGQRDVSMTMTQESLQMIRQCYESTME